MKNIILLTQYAAFSVAGFLIYAPSYILNVPNNTLENLLPEGACKFLFNDKKICQDHVKCLFGLCDKPDEEEPITLYSGGSKRVRKNKRLARKLARKKPDHKSMIYISHGGAVVTNPSSSNFIGGGEEEEEEDYSDDFESDSEDGNGPSEQEVTITVNQQNQAASPDNTTSTPLTTPTVGAVGSTENQAA